MDMCTSFLSVSDCYGVPKEPDNNHHLKTAKFTLGLLSTWRHCLECLSYEKFSAISNFGEAHIHPNTIWRMWLHKVSNGRICLLQKFTFCSIIWRSVYGLLNFTKNTDKSLELYLMICDKFTNRILPISSTHRHLANNHLISPIIDSCLARFCTKKCLLNGIHSCQRSGLKLNPKSALNLHKPTWV